MKRGSSKLQKKSHPFPEASEAGLTILHSLLNDNGQTGDDTLGATELPSRNLGWQNGCAKG